MMSELPDRLNYLTNLNDFLSILVSQAKEDKLNQREFLNLLICKSKCMLREERENKTIKV